MAEKLPLQNQGFRWLEVMMAMTAAIAGVGLLL